MHRIALLIGLCLGFGLRLYRLGAESLWYDEAVSVYLARTAIPELIAHTAGDIHPPGYYLLLHLWQRVAQPTLAYGLEFLFAWPSLCFGLLILALIYPIGRRLFNQDTALLAVWLTAIHPFHLWYSQEVRMYTIGAGLGLICLWLSILYLSIGQPTQAVEANRSRYTRLFIYAIIAALGLYTLYYFIFLLISLNLIVLVYIVSHAKKIAKEKRREWLLAQIVVLLLWSPWLPTFWRQVTNPPVPPWRVPWQNFGEFLAVVSESGSAYLVGQSPPGQSTWVWALFAGFFIVTSFILILRRNNLASHFILLLYIFIPVLTIYITTAFVTPLYHVRYLFTYAAPFSIIVAACLLAIIRFKYWVGVGILIAVLLISGWSLKEFWFNPSYRADEHRAAVAQLATDWRPGDAILVNAGWIYPILEIYWPNYLANFESAVPPPLVSTERLIDSQEYLAFTYNEPMLIRTGSIDGSPTLGWGNPKSDFFAISQTEMHQTLAQLSTNYSRIWHYRLYDTVSDPTGHLRQWLESNTHLRQNVGYAGRDFLRVQLYETEQASREIAEAEKESLRFEDMLLLDEYITPSAQQVGEILYTDLHWRVAGEEILPLPDLTMSLRLYHALEDTLLVQRDTSPLQPTDSWQTNRQYRQPMALEIPLSAKAGLYRLELVVYDQANGQPLTLPEMEQALFGQRLVLSTIELLPIKQIPQIVHDIDNHIALFDYIELIKADLELVIMNDAADIQLTLVWRPRSNAYRDNYTAVFELFTLEGEMVQQWDEPIGSLSYPSGLWPPLIPIQESKYLSLDEAPIGDYELTLRLERSSDGLAIQAQKARWFTKNERIVIGRLTPEK